MIAKPKRHPNISASILPDGYVLLEMKPTDWVYVLTPLAAVAWEFCDGESTVADIVRSVAEMQAPTSDAELTAKVGALLEEFENASLITA